MPPKRAAASVAAALSFNSNHEDVLAFLADVLSPTQYDEVTDKWAEDQMSPTGQVLLNAQKSDLKKMGFGDAVATKVVQHLKVARQANMLKENSPAAASTPLIDGAAAQEVDLATDPGPSAPKPRGRGRPPKARQSRLSQRLEVAQMDEDATDDEEPAAEDDDVSSDVEEEAEQGNNPSPGAGRSRHSRTRMNISRLATVQRAQKRIQEVEDEFFLGEENEDLAPSDSDDDEVVPTRGRRARPAAEVEEEVEVEATRPEEPDDGVHPYFDRGNCHDWEDAAREGLEDILKTLPFEKLVEIVDDHLNENAMHYYKYRARKNDGSAGTTTKFRSRGYVAQKIVKMTLDGWLKPGKAEGGASTAGAVDNILDLFSEEYVKSYLDNILLKRFASTPKISDTRRLLWRLWCTPVSHDGPEEVSLGQITFPLKRIGIMLRNYWQRVVDERANCPEDPYMANADLNAAYKKKEESMRIYEESVARGGGASGSSAAAAIAGIKPDPDADYSGGVGPSVHPPLPEIMFADPTEDCPHDWDDLFEQLLNIRRLNISPRWRLDVEGMKLFGEVVVDLRGTKGDVLVHTAYVRNNQGLELVQIWLDKILQAMDHLQGTELLEKDLEALNDAWDKSCDYLDTKEVDLTLEPPKAVDIKIFDQIMAGVENFERPMEAGVDAKCRESIKLKLKPYQKRALSFMLREEKAPGGTSRHLWLKVPLPGNQPGVECYMSPSLFQLYISKSPTATGIALGNTGGGGWQALEMGMGKTAVIIAGILFNPPPPNWRRQRPWKPYTPDDYMLTKTENMPRGGTLVIVPTTLARQWETEIIKTLKDPDDLSVLRWTDAKRTVDCKEIAQYDIVLTTPQQVTRDSTLRSIYWHRIVVDEAQLNAGSLMQSGILISTHRWIVSGTPCNAHPESLRPSLEFLRLGGYNDAQRHLPPALATVMRAVMCRYTKNGAIEGETNLQLRELVEKNIQVDLNEEDINDERDEGVRAFMEYQKHLSRAMKASGQAADTTIEELIADPERLKIVAKLGRVRYPSIRKAMNRIRSVVAGGHEVTIPNQFVYSERKGHDVPETRYFQSKAQTVVACLEEVRRNEPGAKVLIFSEYEETLKSIAKLLPGINLDYRSIFGGTSAKKRGEAIEAFMTDPPTRVFLLVAKPGAVGITLTSANHVFICEPQMNPAIEAQAIGRSQRMGQERQVTVHRFFTKNTVEERVRQLIARRHGGPSARMVSTAMAANPGAGEVLCNLADWYHLLKVELEDSSDEEEEQEDDDEMILD